MKTSSAKSKGRRCSQEVKDLLLMHAPILKDDDIVITPSGVTGPDLHLSPKAKESYPFVIECKNVEKIQMWESLKQAESHVGRKAIAGETITPMLFFKRNHSVLYCALKAEDLMRLISNRRLKYSEHTE